MDTLVSIALDLTAAPETLAESELFGHTKGAFTGVHHERIGKFELAHGGILFLDEIGDLPLSVQPKLLRAIKEGEIERVGSNTPFQVDVRLLAATNRDPKSEVQTGRFRADLFHWLNVYPIIVPPLRERVEDIPPLAGHLAERTRRRLGLGGVGKRALPGDPQGGVPSLQGQSGPARPRSPGRESGSPPASQPDDLHAVYPAPVGKSLHRAVEEFRHDLIRQAIEQHQGNWAAAVRDLGMDRGNLYHLAVRLGVRAKPGPICLVRSQLMRHRRSKPLRVHRLNLSFAGDAPCVFSTPKVRSFPKTITAFPPCSAGTWSKS